MEVGHIDFADVWCETNQIPRVNDVPHKLYPADQCLATILKQGPVLGSGRFGKVFRMLNRESGEAVAVKTMKRFIPGNEPLTRATRKVFERELSILRLCCHPNVIQLLQSIETPETAYLVFELCEQTLFDIVVHGTLEEPEMRVVVRGISAGLTYLHSKEIAHRDVKVTNILCTRNPEDPKDLFGSVKLADFGLAACRGSPGTTRLFTCSCGTPEYMAPEVLMRDPYDTKCDCWSLGVVVYFSLIGEEPFPGITEAEVTDSISGSSVTLDDEIWIKFSSGLQSLLKRMLVVDPLSRISASKIHEDAWTQNSDNSTSPAPSKHSRRPKSSASLLEQVHMCLVELTGEQEDLPTHK